MALLFAILMYLLMITISSLCIYFVFFKLAPLRSLISRTRDQPSTMIVLSLLNRAVIWRRDEGRIHKYIVKFHCSDMHILVVHDYFTNLHLSCDFTEQRFARLFYFMFSYGGPGSSIIRAKIVSSLTQELIEFFRMPRFKKNVEENYLIKKHQLVQLFLSFLVDILYHKTESFVPYKNEIDNLEKELRFLLTIFGDKSLTLCGDEYLMENFEAVANEAGSFIHSLLFSSTDRSFGKMNIDLAAVLYQLQANVKRFSRLLQCNSEPADNKTPKNYMVDSLILNSLIYDLQDLISREDKWIADVKEEIKILHKGLTILQCFIKEVRLPEIGELGGPWKAIGNMAHQAEYVIISFLSGDAPLWYLKNRLAYINPKIELIATELQEITRRHALKAAIHFNTQTPLQGEGNVEIVNVIVDFNDRRERDVLDYLVGRGKSLEVISISGMPGLGKTTLAKKLFNHPSITSWFDKKSWCVVSQSQEYKRQSVLADILTQINGAFGKDRTLKMDSESLVVQIYQTLYGRRYLIVIDDVWGSDLWDDLMRCFPDDGNGSRILFTTRNDDAGPSNCNHYPVPSLSNDECWELLQKKVFGDNTCPPMLIGTGKKIAANCWGLPIAVVVIAGILSTMDKEKFLWKEVKRNLSLYICDGGDNSMMQILELSYRHLPERLKPCFLYFTSFIEQKKILVGELMRLWISEGFIHKEEGKSAEDVAQQYLMELIDKSLVMVDKRRSDGGVKTCVLHDLLRDFCYKVCNQENFLRIVITGNQSLYEIGLYTLESDKYIAWSYCNQVRSLPKAYKPTFYLTRMRLLRVLHSPYISDHLSGVEYLVNLRYLVIRDLPASIGCLVKLEYLRVEEIQEVVYLPLAILRMVKLRYLKVDQARYGEYIESFRTNNLDFLSNISIRKPKDEEMLKYSPNLRKLKCQHIRESPSSIFDLSFLSHLESLKIQLHESSLMQISFPSNIKKLSVYGWHNLPWEMMSIIGRLEKLEVLKIGCLTGFKGKGWNTREGEFQNLKFLKLDRLQDLTEWNVESSSHFPALQQLVLSHCKKLQEIPCEIGEIPTLQMIEINGHYAESLVESAKLIKQQKKDMEDEDLRLLITTTC